MLFTQNQRTDSGPRRYTESIYEFLDRSARQEYEKVRTVLEKWCASVPDAERNEFIQRLSSGADHAFHAAFLELYIHELLICMNHKVVFHPELLDSTRHPDFFATAQDGSECIVECTVATEESDKERSARARLNTLYEMINQIESPDVFLALRITGTPNSPVKLVDWQNQIQEWLGTLDYDALQAVVSLTDDDQLPHLELKHDGLLVIIKPIPKKHSCRSKASRNIGLLSSEARFVTSQNKIREKILKKANYYGKFQCPYIIVVNCLGEYSDEEEIHAAIFGESGLWKKSTTKSQTRVSAVLAIHQLLPWSVTVAKARLYHNPNAKHPYSGPLTSLPHTTSELEIDGIHPHVAMRVDAKWPHGESIA
jgi:hypothetical protein